MVAKTAVQNRTPGNKKPRLPSPRKGVLYAAS
jgi:hypothetical protein